MKKLMLLFAIFLCFSFYNNVLLSKEGKWELVDSLSKTINNIPYVINLVDIDCADKDNCVAFGNFNYYQQPMNRLTSDGGNSWSTTYLDSNSHNQVVAVAYPDTNLCLVLLDSAYFLRSTDRCQTWSKLKVDCYTGNAFYYFGRLKMANKNVGGFTNVIDFFLTDDGGLSWNKIDFNLPDSLTPKSISDICFLDKDNIFLLVYKKELDKYLIKSKDGGKSWQAMPGIKHTPNRLVFIDENTGWVSGEGTWIDSTKGYSKDFIAKTEDGGLTWTTQLDSTAGYYGIKKIYFTDKLNGFALGFDSWFFWRTTDGGNIWVKDTTYNPDKISWNFSDLAVVTPDLMYGISDYYGIIEKYSSFTGINEKISTNAIDFSVNPNVINKGDQINLHFVLIGGSDVKFIIYDNSGNVADKSDLFLLGQGEHNIRYSPSINLLAGWYWIKMSINNSQEIVQPVVIY